MKTRLLICIPILLLAVAARSQTAITVDVSKKLRTLSGVENGVNIDYLMDGGITSPTTPLATSLKNMGVKLLRYPGGEKSDNYLWSASPWTAASPRMALLDTINAWPTSDSRFVDQKSAQRLCKPAVLDFDELMTAAKQAGAQPLIVVAYDAIYNVKTLDRPTKAQLITNAVEWVRYANITKKFGIKYWMIGNESWNHPDYNGRTTPEQYAIDLFDFAKAMKAVDPTIKIVANGKFDWWPALLQSAAVSYIDVLAFSYYPVLDYTNGYESYRTNTKRYTGEIDDAVNAINAYAPAADRARINVIAAEFSSIDFNGGWSNDNNLGHALCNFQLFGDMVVNPKVESACLWNTRWVTNETEEQHMYDALDKTGKLNATGMAQQVWGSGLLQNMVATTGSNNLVKVYASFDSASKKVNIFLLNKDVTAATVNLSLPNYSASLAGAKYVFSGTSVDDKFPTFTRTDTISNAAALTSLSLAPASVTVLKLAVAPELPTTLLSFTGTIVDGDARLTWQVQNDVRLQQYSVERSFDKKTFLSVGTVPVSDPPTSTAIYNFTDTGFTAAAPNYYRLKLTGRDGSIRFSDTIKLEQAVDGSVFNITIAPNPAGSKLVLQTQSGAAHTVTLRLVDALGRVWASEKVAVPAGAATLTLDRLQGLQRGVYWLQVQGVGKQRSLPFLKQ